MNKRLKAIWLIDYTNEAGQNKYIARQADTEAEARRAVPEGAAVTRVWLFMEPTPQPAEPAT
jgi:hypothetical protein